MGLDLAKLQKLLDTTKKQYEKLQQYREDLNKLTTELSEIGDEAEDFVKKLEEEIKSGSCSLKEGIDRVNEELKKYKTNSETNTKFINDTLTKHGVGQGDVGVSELIGRLNKNLNLEEKKFEQVFSGLFEPIEINLKTQYLNQKVEEFNKFILSQDAFIEKFKPEDTAVSYKDFKSYVDEEVTKCQELHQEKIEVVNTLLSETLANAIGLAVGELLKEVNPNNNDETVDEFTTQVKEKIAGKSKELKSTKEGHIRTALEGAPIFNDEIKGNENISKALDDSEMGIEEFKGLVNNTIGDLKNAKTKAREGQINTLIEKINDEDKKHFTLPESNEATTNFKKSDAEFTKGLNGEFNKQAVAVFTDNYKKQLEDVGGNNIDEYIAKLEDNAENYKVIRAQIEDDIVNAKIKLEEEKNTALAEWETNLSTEYPLTSEESAAIIVAIKKEFEEDNKIGVGARINKAVEEKVETAKNKRKADKKALADQAIKTAAESTNIKEFTEEELGEINKSIEDPKQTVEDCQTLIDAAVERLKEENEKFEEYKKEFERLLEDIEKLDPKTYNEFGPKATALFNGTEKSKNFEEGIAELKNLAEDMEKSAKKNAE